MTGQTVCYIKVRLRYPLQEVTYRNVQSHKKENAKLGHIFHLKLLLELALYGSHLKSIFNMES